MSFFSDLIMGPEQNNKQTDSDSKKPDNLFHGNSGTTRPAILQELKSPAFLRKVGAEYNLDGRFKKPLTPQDIDKIIDTILPSNPYRGNISIIETTSAAKKFAKEIYQMQKDLKPNTEIIAKQEMLRFFKTIFGL